jgi:hypothetical protein
MTTETAEYGGCGCAGGEVVTMRGAQLAAGRRTQKLYHDALGRIAKTEILDWNGSVYATTANTYNARDQLTLVRRYQGADTGNVYQDMTMTYDGYGRLKTRHAPEQQVVTNNSATTDHTTWAYNPDDTLQKVTDARGAVVNYLYNNRHLVTGLTYTAPAGITPTPSVIPVRLPAAS